MNLLKDIQQKLSTTIDTGLSIDEVRRRIRSIVESKKGGTSSLSESSDYTGSVFEEYALLSRVVGRKQSTPDIKLKFHASDGGTRVDLSFDLKNQLLMRMWVVVGIGMPFIVAFTILILKFDSVWSAVGISIGFTLLIILRIVFDKRQLVQGYERDRIYLIKLLTSEPTTSLVD